MDSNMEVLIESFKNNNKSNNARSMNVFESVQFLSRLDGVQTESNIDRADNGLFIEKALEKINRSIEKENTFVWPFSYCPYFTHEEVLQFRGYYSEGGYDTKDPHKMVKILSDKLRETEDPDEIAQIKADMDALSSWAGEGDEFYESVATGTQFNPKSWNKKMVELDTQLKLAEDPDEIDFIKQQMVNLGWNPEIEYNPENQIKAKARIESIYNRNHGLLVLDETSFINNSDSDNGDLNTIMESGKNNMNPIHVIVMKGDSPFSNLITTATHSQFSHSAVCVDNDFNKLYSFNLNNGRNFGGFSVEDIDKYPKENRLAVFTFFVDDINYANIKERIKMLADNVANTTYSAINILLMPFKQINLNLSNSMICSQFVDSILKMANINITGKDSSKVVPNDFYKASSTNGKIYKVFDGVTKDFNSKKIIRYTNSMAKKVKPYTENEISNLLADYTYGSIVEFKLPVEFNKEGDLLLTNKFIDFDSEYASSHKLLVEYEKAGNIEGIKYELARLYYMNYILERRLYHNKYLKNKEKNIKTRARVLNDFKKYFKIVMAKDPMFNFAEYYEKSVFYPHTIEVTSSTMMHMKDIIKHIL